MTEIQKMKTYKPENFVIIYIRFCNHTTSQNSVLL